MNKLEQIKLERPDIAVKVRWTPDDTYEWDGDGPDPVETGFYPHDVDVLAFAIVKGEIHKVRVSLGGCYSPLDGPHCPNVHGYLNQLVDEAVAELSKILTELPQ